MIVRKKNLQYRAREKERPETLKLLHQTGNRKETVNKQNKQKKKEQPNKSLKIDFSRAHTVNAYRFFSENTFTRKKGVLGV